MQDIQVHPVSDKNLHLDFFKSLTRKKSLLKYLLNRWSVLYGSLRLNNQTKSKSITKNLPDFVEADITPLNMGNKLYVTQFLPDFKIMHPDNTVICQVKISRAAMKAAQEAAKLQSTCKRKEKIFFLHISSISFTLVLFFVHFF
jgi:large subunit ribosomal protein L25